MAKSLLNIPYKVKKKLIDQLPSGGEAPPEGMHNKLIIKGGNFDE